jgi:hypothetical protein
LFQRYGNAVVETVAIERQMNVKVRNSLWDHVTTPSEIYILAKRIAVNAAKRMPKKNILAILSSTSFTVENLKNLVIVTGGIIHTEWYQGFNNSHY